VLGVGREANPGDQRFSSLKDVVSEKTLKAVGEMGFSEMMEIQYRCIRPLLEGRYPTVCGWEEGWGRGEGLSLDEEFTSHEVRVNFTNNNYSFISHTSSYKG